MRRTKIVCTIGPASEDKELFTEMVKAGLNVARLNFSHGTHDEHKKRIEMIKEVRRELDLPIAIMLDTKGPEIRTGIFENGYAELKTGELFEITVRDILGNNCVSSVSYEGLPGDVLVGSKILIDDGLIELEVEEIKDSESIMCRVLNGGILKNRKSINIPDVQINLPALTDEDIADIMFGIENDIDYIAASFIRKADDVNTILKVLEDNGAGDIQIISKIENRQGVDNIDEIIEASKGIMVARGDLGVEIPTEEVPMVQKMIIRKCNNQSKPVITATQMLDSMIRNPRPTRAEATDIANAILDGTDAIMLSGETAAGKYPLESIKTMVNIARITEESINYRKALEERRKLKTESVTYAVSHATCSTALDLNATAIITTTSSGYTPRMVSKFRPKAPIIAATSSEKVRRRMALLWGVYSVSTTEGHSTDEIFNKAIRKSKEAGYIKDGELIIITAGVPVGVAGSTNVMKVHIVGEILIKGTGIGKNHVTGSVFAARDAKQLEGFKEGDILVCENTDIDMMHVVEKSSGLIVEEGGYTSHAAIVGLSLGLPVIVGALGAVEKLSTGQIVTIDCIRGLVYNGKTRVI